MVLAERRQGSMKSRHHRLHSIILKGFPIQKRAIIECSMVHILRVRLGGQIVDMGAPQKLRFHKY